MDTGCCFAQDIRQLVFDGAPIENILEADLRPELINHGYNIFRDRATLKSKFLIGDVFDETAGPAFGELEGKIDIIYAASFFRLFNWADPVGVPERVVQQLKPIEGSLIFGRQKGHVIAGESEHRINEKGNIFKHNEKSWREMWKQVGKAAGSSWDVKVWSDKEEDFGRYEKNEGNELDDRLDSGDRRLTFEITRALLLLYAHCWHLFFGARANRT